MIVILKTEDDKVLGSLDCEINTENGHILTKNGLEIDFVPMSEKESKEKRKRIDDYIEGLFAKVWDVYPKKTDKIQSKKTWHKKLKKMKSEDKILEKARKIVQMLFEFKKIWEREKRQTQFVPSFSSWMNSNIPD